MRIEYGRFRAVQIWKLQYDLAARLLFVPFVNMSGLHAAVMHNRGVAASLASKSAQAILHSMTVLNRLAK